MIRRETSAQTASRAIAIRERRASEARRKVKPWPKRRRFLARLLAQTGLKSPTDVSPKV